MRLHTLQPAPGAKSTRKELVGARLLDTERHPASAIRGRKPGLVVSENAVSKEDKHPFTKSYLK